MENNNFDIADLLDLPYDEICINLHINKYMAPRLVNFWSIINSEKYEINTERITWRSVRVI